VVASLVLPALLLRALIPVGFMPVADAGGLAIGFCPGAGALPPGAAMAHDHGHHMGSQHLDHAGGHLGGAGGAHHAPCLFAASATVAGAPTTPALLLGTTVITPSAAVAVSRFSLPTILRAQFPRGPPLLT
jgi:hypothetical protein